MSSKIFGYCTYTHNTRYTYYRAGLLCVFFLKKHITLPKLWTSVRRRHTSYTIFMYVFFFIKLIFSLFVHLKKKKSNHIMHTTMRWIFFEIKHPEGDFQRQFLDDGCFLNSKYPNWLASRETHSYTARKFSWCFINTVFIQLYRKVRKLNPPGLSHIKDVWPLRDFFFRTGIHILILFLKAPS